MIEIKTNLLDLADGVVDILTGPANRIVAKPVTRYLLEVEDALFHHNSAVLMPNAPEKSAGDQAEASEKQKAIGGLDVLRVCIVHAMEHKDQKMIVVGHTDRSGQAAYNLKLSQQRSDNVFHALMGNKDDWVTIANDRHKVEDYKQILKWAANRKGWPCDPGVVNNVNDAKTKAAVKAFQDNYNKAFGKDIAVDGIVGKQTWGAIFDLYEEWLAEKLNMTPEKLTETRGTLKFIDDGKKTVGCGEEQPIDKPDLDEYRSAENRRVEILFFDPDEHPKLDCHPGPNQCKPELCQIYDKNRFGFKYLPVTPTPPTLPPRIDITKIETTNPKAAEPGEDPFEHNSDFSPTLDEVAKIHVRLSHFRNGFTGKLRLDIARLIAPEDDAPGDAGKFGFLANRKKIVTLLKHVRAAIKTGANAQDKAAVTGDARVTIVSTTANGVEGALANHWTSKPVNVPIAFRKIGDDGVEGVLKTDDGWVVTKGSGGSPLLGLAHNNGTTKLEILLAIEVDSERRITAAEGIEATTNLARNLDKLIALHESFQLIRRIEQDITVGAKALKLEIEWDGNAGVAAARKYSNRRTRDHHDNKLYHIPMEAIANGAKCTHGLYFIERITVLKDAAEIHNHRFKTTAVSVPQLANLTFNGDWARSVRLFGLAPFQSNIEEGLRRYATRDYDMRDADTANRMNVRFITDTSKDNTVTFLHSVGGINTARLTLFGSTPGPDGPPRRNIYSFFDALLKTISIFPETFLLYNTLPAAQVRFRGIFAQLGIKADTNSGNRQEPDARSVAGDGTVTGAANATDFGNVTVTLDNDGMATVVSTDTSVVPATRAADIQRALRAIVRFLGNTTNHEQAHSQGVTNEPRANRRITIDGVTVGAPLLGDPSSHNITTANTNIMDRGATRSFQRRIEDGVAQQQFAAINARYLRECVPHAPEV